MPEPPAHKLKLSKWPVASVSVEPVVRLWNGSRHHTNSGHSKSHLMKNKTGKVVTKKSHAAGRRAYKNIRGWTQAVSKARKALGITGFCAVKKGTALYKKAREFYN